MASSYLGPNRLGVDNIAILSVKKIIIVETETRNAIGFTIGIRIRIAPGIGRGTSVSVVSKDRSSIGRGR